MNQYIESELKPTSQKARNGPSTVAEAFAMLSAIDNSIKVLNMINANVDLR